MAHIPDDELALYAFDPHMVAPVRRTEIEREVASCTDCQTSLDFMTISDLEVADPDVWEPLKGSQTLDALRDLAVRVAAEDEEAEALLAPMLAAPGLTAWTDLSIRRRYRTGGVVRKLIAHAASLHEREPLDALTFADAAISVAEALPLELYPAKAVYELRGTAWKERANALMYLSRFEEGLESCRRAERAYRELVAPGLGLASVAYVRASIFTELEKYDDADEAARAAERGFAHLGEEERQMRAVMLQGIVAFLRAQFDQAIRLFQRIYDYGESSNNPLWIARAAQALGNCHIDGGSLDEASLYLHRALTHFRALEQRSQVTRTEWAIARVMVASGRTSDAIPRLRNAMHALERAGMVTDAALVGLDLAEALLALGHKHAVAVLASDLFTTFHSAGMITGALSAIAFLREAAERGTVAKPQVDAVRRFLRRVERQPELLFVPPPDSFS